MGRTPDFDARTPDFDARTPDFVARTPDFVARTPDFDARTPDFDEVFDTPWGSSERAGSGTIASRALSGVVQNLR